MSFLRMTSGTRAKTVGLSEELKDEFDTIGYPGDSENSIEVGAYCWPLQVHDGLYLFI